MVLRLGSALRQSLLFRCTPLVLGRRPVIHDYVESWVLTSNKCFAEFPADA